MIRGDGMRARFGTSPDSTVDSRLPYVAAFVILVFLVFVFRLFQLQLIQGQELIERSERNFVRTVRLEAPRGDIVDRFGRTVATTRPAFGLQVIPSELQKPALTYAALSLLIDADAETLARKVGQPRGRERFQAVRLAGDLSHERRARVESHRYALPGVVTNVRPRRHYVEGDLVAHLVGTLGEISRAQLKTREFASYRQGQTIGQSGVEALLERHLRGRAGGRNVVVDVAGREIQNLDEVKPLRGGGVVLTLDLDLQRAAAAALRGEDPGGRPRPRAGAVVALDPRNGEVLVLVASPAYDPNAFAGGIDAEAWRQLTENPREPLQNRAVAGQYPPGSTYKALLAAAALQAGVVTPDEKFFCPGTFRLGRRTYHCWRRHGHGEVDLRDALVRSCDVYFYQLGLRLGIDRIAEFAHGFGLGRRTGIAPAAETAGLVPTREWKERRFREPWVRGETVSTSIGQGFNLVTPVQLAVAFAAIANGGTLVVPQLVLRTLDREGNVVGEASPAARGRVPVAPEHLAFVGEALAGVVQDPGGTGGRARVRGVTVAGKTGTSQVVRLEFTEDMEEDDLPERFRDHAWFAAFAPAERPEIVVAVVVEHGGHGGSAAAPVAQRVLARYFEERESPPPQLAAAAQPVDSPEGTRAED